MKYIVEHITYPIFYKIAKGEKGSHLRDIYAKKASFNAFLVIFYTGSSIWGYKVLKNSGFLWKELGGDSKRPLLEAFSQFPFEERFEGMMDYSFYTFGYHVSSLFLLIFFEKRLNDYEEMLVHHLTTCFLYLGYFFGNFQVIGVLIAFLHDLADIPTALIKLLGSTIYTTATLAVFLPLVITWGYTRLYVFPQIILVTFTEFGPISMDNAEKVGHSGYLLYALCT